MRIGLFSDTYVPDINGVVTSVLALKEGLEKQGHTVFVVTTHQSVIKAAYENNVLYLPGVELKFLYGYTMSSPIHIRGLEIVNEMALDIIHVHSEFGVGIFGRIAAKQLKLPLVSTYHTQYEDYTHYVNLLNSGRFEDFSKKAVATLSRMYSRSLQSIIAPSEKTKKMLLRYDIRKEITVIPTGLDFKKFKVINDELVEEIKNTYQLHDKFVITYLGRVAEEKGIDVVFNAFSELIKVKPNVRLMIVGGGPQLEDLKALSVSLGLKDVVIFVGPVKAELVPSYYHASNAFVSASLTETQGLTYIEALASGLVVFARPDKPLEEVVLDHKTGFLFESSEEFVLKACEYMEMSLEEKQVMKDNADVVLVPYDIDVFIDNVLKVYQKAIDDFFGKYIVSEYNVEDDKVTIKLVQGQSVDVLTFDKEIIERRYVEEGMEMSRNQIISLEEDQKVYEAYQLSIRRIALRDYTSFEISEYIRSKMNVTQEDIDTVLELLRKRRFIDDDRYFEDKISYHRSQLRGNQWIVDDLVKRGFLTQDVLNYLEDENINAYLERGIERAESFIKKQNKGSKMQRKLKLKEHLIRQGYDTQIIKTIINEMVDEYDNEDEILSLRKAMQYSIKRYSKRLDKSDVKEKVMRNAISKGYPYEMVKKVMEELNIDED